MGTLQSAISTIANFAVNHGGAYAQGDQRLAQLEQENAMRQAQRQADAAFEKERMALENAHAEDNRKTALKRAVASQRARFGAQGVGSSNGSSQAVLLGFLEESEEEKEHREALNALKERAIDQNVSQQNSINALQRSQLSERNALDGVTGILKDIV